MPLNRDDTRRERGKNEYTRQCARPLAARQCCLCRWTFHRNHHLPPLLSPLSRDTSRPMYTMSFLCPPAPSRFSQKTFGDHRFPRERCLVHGSRSMAIDLKWWPVMPGPLIMPHKVGYGFWPILALRGGPEVTRIRVLVGGLCTRHPKLVVHGWTFVPDIQEV